MSQANYRGCSFPILEVTEPLDSEFRVYCVGVCEDQEQRKIFFCCELAVSEDKKTLTNPYSLYDFDYMEQHLHKTKEIYHEPLRHLIDKWRQ